MLDNEIEVIELTPKEDYISTTLKYGFDDMVVGQDKAKEAIISTIVNNLNSITSKKGPLAVLFFYGPSGVGKTEIAHALAQVTMGDPNRITKVKCEHFQESHMLSNLIGSPKGYIGSNEESILGKNIYNHIKEARKAKEASNIIARYSHFNIILFDEIEKAHPLIHQGLLGIMDDGILTLSNGTEIDFSESIIIMTSNIGARQKREIEAKTTMGFVQSNKEQDKEAVNKEAFKLFSPEFLGRIDAKVEFNDLTHDDCRQIIDICLTRLNEVLDFRYENDIITKINLQMEESVYDWIIERGFDKAKGARQLVRVFNQNINSKFGKILKDNDALYEFPKKEAMITAVVKNGEVKFELRKDNITETKVNNVVPLLPNK